MKRIANLPSPERMLGLLGLTLIVLIGWACDQQTDEAPTLAARARRILGRLVIELITGIGWAFDRIAPIDGKAATGRDVDHRQPMPGERP
jgi:hypothetical protein